MNTGDKVAVLFPPKYTGRVGVVTHIGGLDLIELRLSDGEELLIERSAIALIESSITQCPAVSSFVNPFAK